MHLSWALTYTYVMGEDVGCCLLGTYYIAAHDISIVNTTSILTDSSVQDNYGLWYFFSLNSYVLAKE